MPCRISHSLPRPKRTVCGMAPYSSSALDAGGNYAQITFATQGSSRPGARGPSTCRQPGSQRSGSNRALLSNCRGSPTSSALRGSSRATSSSQQELASRSVSHHCAHPRASSSCQSWCFGGCQGLTDPGSFFLESGPEFGQPLAFV